MKMIQIVKLPLEPFNTAVKNGTAGKIIERILEETKPESVYFMEQEGKRGAVMVIELNHQSEIPKFAEPWFLNFDASCEFRIAMSPEDLMRAGLDELGKKWG